MCNLKVLDVGKCLVKMPFSECIMKRPQKMSFGVTFACLPVAFNQFHGTLPLTMREMESLKEAFFQKNVAGFAENIDDVLFDAPTKNEK
jgi:hypothetical protein